MNYIKYIYLTLNHAGLSTEDISIQFSGGNENDRYFDSH